MSVATRFAPSPTGLLHLGNARTALIAWLFARHQGGTMLLRLDDTDAERCTPALSAAIETDLRWLGLDWDAYARQSDRTGRYDVAIERLKASGRLYPCYETPEELALRRKTLLAMGRPPIYDRAALTLTAAERTRLEAAGRRPHWRFRLDHAPIEWQDRVRGAVRFEGRDLSDPVLVREDGRPLYHLGSVVDDIEFGITDVVRGEDHVANTAAHIQMFVALGAPPPAFAHLPLVLDTAGHSLSKRFGSLSLEALRTEEDLEPMAVVSVLAKLGTADPIEPRRALEPLIAEFDFAKFARASPRLDPEDLHRINARILHDTPFAAVAERLAARGLGGIGEAFWMVVRPNLTRLGDVAEWWRVATGPVAPVLEDADFAGQAAVLLPDEPWDSGTWSVWADRLRRATGRQGRGLFRPLRLALTGRDHGPELKALLPLIGRDRVMARLQGNPA